QREDPAEEIEIVAPIRVADVCAFPLREDQRLLVVRRDARKEELLVLRSYFVGRQTLDIGRQAGRAFGVGHVHREITTFLSVKNSTESRPCAFRSPKNDPFVPPKGKNAIGAATPMFTPIMLTPTR